jgi:hypothetical protein
MQVDALKVDQYDAERLYRKYREHRAYDRPNPIDREIERIYRQIARGKTVIRALSSIVKAGLGADGLPKLAIVRADAQRCHLKTHRDGRAEMCLRDQFHGRVARDCRFNFDAGSFSFPPHVNERWGWGDYRAIVPHIPPEHRPRRGLANYHILFEAVWTKEVPVDPMLLRRIGKGDTWLVCAAWDLTDVERAVLADRLRSH